MKRRLIGRLMRQHRGVYMSPGVYSERPPYSAAMQMRKREKEKPFDPAVTRRDNDWRERREKSDPFFLLVDECLIRWVREKVYDKLLY